jgi:hypothetical protein
MADEETQDYAEPAASVPVPVGPVTTTTTGGDTSQATSTRAAPGEMDAIQAALAAGTGAATSQNAIGDAQELRSTQLADAQAEQSDLLRQQASDAAAEHQDMLDRLEEARAAHSQAEAAVSKEPFHTLLSSDVTGKSLIRQIGLMFTALSGSQVGMDAIARQVDNEIKNDFATQKANRDDQIEKAKRSGANVMDLYSQWEKQNAMAAVKEQRAREALAAKIVEIGTRAGIPVDKLQNNVLVQKMLAEAEAKKAQALSHFDAHFTTTRELTPKVSVQEGKTAKGQPQGQENLQSDVDLLRAHPPSRAALDAARRAVMEHPTILQEAAGLLQGGKLPDFFSGLSEEDRASAEAVLRVTPRIAQAQFNSTRAVTDKEALATVMESSIPVAGEDKAAATRKQRNLLRATGRDFAPPTAPTGEAPVPAASTPAAPAAPAKGGMVKIRDSQTGTVISVTRAEAIRLGALKGSN